MERIIANGSNAIRNGYVGKAWAITERIIANACNTIRNGYACKAWAIIERTPVNAGNAVRYGYACKAWTTRERITTNACNAIRNGYACKIRAICERIITNACHAIRNGYVGKIIAILERIISNASNMTVYNYGFKSAWDVIRVVVLSTAIIVMITVRIRTANAISKYISKVWHISCCISTCAYKRKSNALKAWAIIECTIVNICNVIWYSYFSYRCILDAVDSTLSCGRSKVEVCHLRFYCEFRIYVTFGGKDVDQVGGNKHVALVPAGKVIPEVDGSNYSYGIGAVYVLTAICDRTAGGAWHSIGVSRVINLEYARAVTVYVTLSYALCRVKRKVFKALDLGISLSVRYACQLIGIH